MERKKQSDTQKIRMKYFILISNDRGAFDTDFLLYPANIYEHFNESKT
jgi:hypothetical protein